jgi:hypothetical protein
VDDEALATDHEELTDVAEPAAEVASLGFVAGLDLAEALYGAVIEPLLARRMPGLTYGAALLGPGADVLGFDTPVSTDRDWGPRLQLFLSGWQLERFGEQLDDLLQKELPDELHGFATRVGDPPRHRVELATLPEFVLAHLGFDPTDGITLRDWLTTPQQRLLELTAGLVLRDDGGELEQARSALAFYPDPLWLYLMAAQWARIAQLEPLVGRTGVVGNDTGSRVVAAKLVRELMRLAFLTERRYAPYEKWLGSAFARLHCAGRLGPLLGRVLGAYDWTQRENHLVEAYRVVATLHNNLGRTDPLETEASSFQGRPYKVIHGDRFAAALHAAIDHPAVAGLPRGLGAIDQVTDNAELLTSPERCRRLGPLWDH